jgi:membrane protein
MFLAGGLAFNVLLAAVPFILLLASGLGYLLGLSPERATETVSSVLAMLLPARLVAPGQSILDPVISDIVRTRALAGIGGAIGFIWFSTRLFGSLRSVMAIVFEHRTGRGIIHGKLWDAWLVVAAAILLSVWVSVNAFLVVGTGRLGAVLTQLGMLGDVVSGVEYVIARVISIAAIWGIFLALYRWLPARRTPWQVTMIGGAAAAALFELARWVFAAFTNASSAGTSLYTGTMAVLITVVFWTYYAALIFILGAEVAHAAQRHLAPPAET